MKQINFYLFVFIFSTIACTSNTTNNTSRVNNSSRNNNELSLSDLTLQIPEGWEQVEPSNNMRIAQLRLEEDPAINLAIFYFGPQDMQESNISRWKDQYTEIKDLQFLEVNNTEITALLLLGTFKKKPYPMAQEYTEESNYGTLAAIIKSKDGPYYLKFSAKEDQIEKQRESFIQLLNSIKKN